VLQIPLDVLRLWDLLPRPAGTYVRWFARMGNDRFGGGVDTVQELALAVASADGMNFYVAPNPASTRAGTRHRAVDVTHWSWFLVDIDPVEDNARPEVVAENVLGLLNGWWDQNFDLRRPLLIHSGRGVQIWIRLEDIIMMDQKMIDWHPELQERRVARITNGFWLDKLAAEVGTLFGCRIDTTCKDLPRVMRCPGTRNVKTGRDAFLIVPSAEVYEGLAGRMIAGVPKEKFVPVPTPVLPAGTPWQTVFVHLTLRAQEYLTNGRDEPGRHDTMFHVALCLAERGLERDEVRRAIQHGNSRWDAYHPGAEMTLEPEDIEHALDTAFRRLRRSQVDDTIDLEEGGCRDG